MISELLQVAENGKEDSKLENIVTTDHQYCINSRSGRHQLVHPVPYLPADRSVRDSILLRSRQSTANNKETKNRTGLRDVENHL